MFGGWGLYVDGLFMALIATERLYLKVDNHSRPRFEAAGCEPFIYDAQGKQVALGYWTAPADALDCAALMLPWARLAFATALVAAAAKAKPQPQPQKTKLKPLPAPRHAAPKKTRASRA
jgi:DNA transformation protein and related proteins